MTPETAEELQRRYAEARRRYVADPSNGLIPYPSKDATDELEG